MRIAHPTGSRGAKLHEGLRALRLLPKRTFAANHDLPVRSDAHVAIANDELIGVKFRLRIEHRHAIMIRRDLLRSQQQSFLMHSIADNHAHRHPLLCGPHAGAATSRDGLDAHCGFDDNLGLRFWFPCRAESAVSLRRIIHEMQRSIRQRSLRRQFADGLPALFLRQ